MWINWIKISCSLLLDFVCLLLPLPVGTAEKGIVERCAMPAAHGKAALAAYAHSIDSAFALPGPPGVDDVLVPACDIGVAADLVNVRETVALRAMIADQHALRLIDLDRPGVLFHFRLIA